MPVKDRIVSWWIQNIVIPKREIIDKPGFVITTFTEKNQITYLRDIFIAEHLFELIETKTVENYGEKGKQALYSAGKKFGYIYSSMSNFPTITNSSKEKFSEFAYLLIKYIGGIYAQQATHDLNLEEKAFTITFKDYIICRHNGLGYIMNDGSIAGIWTYAIQDKTIEGIQLECQGRGNDCCLTFCAPEKKIQEKTSIYFSEKELPELKFDETYKKLNEIKETTYAKNSLKDLIDIGFFRYRKGILSYKDMRFFGCESHLLYLLEQEISRLDGGEELLFETCFEYGRLLQELYGHKDYKKFISDFFPALGFGDILAIDSDELKIGVTNYPWTVFSNQSKYIIFRGIMSGFVSNSLDRVIKFNNFDINTRGYLTLMIKT
ncbi:MAG: hypothetical protein JW771_01415 [Candidatus Thermoplasmatota archaeon]|nr:hypothetical protein [Candidatus Thermoplasmatota archaeon]